MSRSRIILSLAALLVLGIVAATVSAQPAPALKKQPPAAKKSQAKPDLKVLDVDEQGKTCLVKIKNIGNAKAEPDRVEIRVFFRGQLKGTFSKVTGALQPGQTRTVRIPTNLNLERHGTRIEVKVDATNVVFEKNEGNNKFVEVNP